MSSVEPRSEFRGPGSYITENSLVCDQLIGAVVWHITIIVIWQYVIARISWPFTFTVCSFQCSLLAVLSFFVCYRGPVLFWEIELSYVFALFPFDMFTCMTLFLLWLYYVVLLFN